MIFNYQFRGTHNDDSLMYTGSQAFESMDDAAHCVSIHKYKAFKATRPEHAVLSRGA